MSEGPGHLTEGKASYYRWGDKLVAVVDDSEEPTIGKRLVLMGRQPGPNLIKYFNPLPKQWRRILQESIKQREEELN